MMGAWFWWRFFGIVVAALVVVVVVDVWDARRVRRRIIEQGRRRP